LNLADTSVIVAGLSSWHERHEDARSALVSCPAAIGHTLVEAYSVLTRLPEPLRVPPDLAAEALARRFTDVVTLDDQAIRAAPQSFARLGITGGAAYDALVALTAIEHGARLLSLDRRASVTYERCGLAVTTL
jgi:predicted nucleic acid-binding protein